MSITFQTIIFFILFILREVECLNIISSSYQVKEGSLVGVSLEYVEWNVNFDQDLNLLYSYKCPPSKNECSSSSPPSACVCDYATKGPTCGTPIFNSSCICDKSLCNQANDWITLEFGKPVNQRTLQKGYYHYYRVAIDSVCKTFSLKLDPNYGDPNAYLSYDNQDPRSDFATLRAVNSGEDRITVCPSHDDYALAKKGAGTVFISVFGWTETSYNITADLLDYEEVTAGVSCEPLPISLPWAKQAIDCLSDNASYDQVLSSTESFFSLAVPNDKCTNISISLISFSANCDFYITDDLSYPGDQPKGSSTYKWSSSVEGYEETLTFVYCPEEKQLETSVYNFLIIRVKGKFGNHFQLRTTTTPEMTLIPLTSIPQVQGATALAGSARMVCDGVYWHCGSYSDCTNFYFVSPSVETRPFWPLPNNLQSLPNFENLPNYISVFPHIPQEKKFTAILILNQEIEYNFRSFFSKNKISNCSIEFLGTLTDSNFSPPKPKISYVSTELVPTCNFTAFYEVQNSMKDLISEMGSLTKVEDLINANFDVDNAALRNSYVGCEELTESLIETETFMRDEYTIQCYATPETEEWLNDPCCNFEEAWDVCCAPRNISVEYIDYKSSKNNVEQCQSPNCVGRYLDEYILDKQFIDDQEIGCAGLLSQGSRSQLYQIEIDNFESCLTASFPKQINSSLSIKDQEINFLNCFVSTMSAPLEKLLRQKWNFSDADDYNEFSTFFRNELISSLSTQDCVHPYNLALNKRFHWENVPEQINCTDSCGELDCVGEKCTIPFECATSFGYEPACPRVWRASFLNEQQCLNQDLRCNWNECANLNDTQCEKLCYNKTSFCGFCDPASPQCLILDNVNDRTMCESTFVCAFNNTLMTNINENACKMLGTCSISEITDRDQCITSGTCSDSRFLQDSFCIHSPIYMNKYGYIEHCENSSWIEDPVGCVDYYSNETTCRNSGSDWYTKATDEQSCLARESCYEISFISLGYSPKNSSYCSDCGGINLKVFEWTNGVWNGAKYVNTEWTSSNFSSIYQWQTTLNLSKLFELVVDSAAIQYSYLLRTKLLCNYNYIMNLISRVSCDCTGGTDCFDIQSESQIGIANICAGNEFDVNVPPATLKFRKDSLDTTTNPEICILLDFHLGFAVDFTTSQVVTFSSELTSKHHNKYASVTNSNGAVVGQITGNGVRIDIGDDEHATLNYLELCILWQPDFIPVDTNEFPVDDMAITDSSGTILNPLSANSYSNITMKITCSTITKEHIVSGRYIFPIRRYSNWENFVVSNYTKAEKVIFYIVGVLYVCMLSFEIYQILMLTIYRTKNQKKIVIPRRFILLLFAIQDILRALFYFISANDAIQQDSIASLILTELPTFIFFSSFSILVCLWASIAHLKINSSTPLKISTFRQITIVGNAFVYAVFILLLVLYQALHNKTSTDEKVCGINTSTQISVPQTTKFKISISYKTFILCFGVLVGTFFATYGFLVFRKVRNLTARVRNSEKKIFLISAVGTASFISHTVLFLIQVFYTNVIAFSIILAILELSSQAVVFTTAGYKPHKSSSSTSQQQSSDSDAIKETIKVNVEVDLPKVDENE